jgi:uncharacterized membrane protein
MAGIELTFSNILQLISVLSPILIAFFMIMLSFMNQNVKGLVFIAGALLASFLNIPLMNTIKSPVNNDASLSCNLIEIPYLNAYNSPSPTSLFIAFTFAYLFLPMMYNNQMNYGVISALLCLFALDSVSKVTNKCTTVGGAVLGALVGFMFGSIWYTIFHMVGADEVLYFDEMESNAVKCEKPSSQTFKCSVYKNGVLVSSNIA